MKKVRLLYTPKIAYICAYMYIKKIGLTFEKHCNIFVWFYIYFFRIPLNFIVCIVVLFLKIYYT